MTDPQGALGSARLPSLDGWRAVSILMVLGAHCRMAEGFPPKLDQLFIWLFDGELGVRSFFVISGFLITRLLQLEYDRSGRVDLSRFYARRALRILPVYFAFIVALAAIQALTPFRQELHVWIANLTFTTNFISDGTWTSGHLWSLGVEEQFYLLWPGLFLLLVAGNNSTRTLKVLAVPILISPVIRVVSYLKMSTLPLLAGYTFLKFFDSLAIGCGCAILLSKNQESVRIWFAKWPRLIPSIAAALIFVPYVLARLFLLGVLTVPFSATLQGLGISALVVQSLIAPGLWPYSVLNHPLLCQIGVLSYSIYIWQQIFCTTPAVFGLEPVWWMSFPMWVISVGLVASVSYYGLERPLFRLRARLRD